MVEFHGFFYSVLFIFCKFNSLQAFWNQIMPQYIYTYYTFFLLFLLFLVVFILHMYMSDAYKQGEQSQVVCYQKRREINLGVMWKYGMMILNIFVVWNFYIYHFLVSSFGVYIVYICIQVLDFVCVWTIQSRYSL